VKLMINAVWAGDADTLRWHKSKAGLVLPIPRRHDTLVK
jgi:hypothetical protein